MIIVFARAPVPGEAKTRLIPSLGEWGAADEEEGDNCRQRHWSSQ